MLLQFFVLGVLVDLGAVTVLAAAVGGPGWWALVVIVVALVLLGIYDLTQRKHSILRNHPVLGHLRFLLESIRPEVQHYFIERNFEGRPYDRDTRSAIYHAPRAPERSSRLAPGARLDQPPSSWERDWAQADPDRFHS